MENAHRHEYEKGSIQYRYKTDTLSNGHPHHSSQNSGQQNSDDQREGEENRQKRERLQLVFGGFSPAPQKITAEGLENKRVGENNAYTEFIARKDNKELP